MALPPTENTIVVAGGDRRVCAQSEGRDLTSYVCSWVPKLGSLPLAKLRKLASPGRDWQVSGAKRFTRSREGRGEGKELCALRVSA